MPWICSSHFETRHQNSLTIFLAIHPQRPNHALQRTGHGGRFFSVCQPLRRHGLSLSLDSLGTAYRRFSEQMKSVIFSFVVAVFAAAVVAASSHGENFSVLPSRKSSVVIPLLVTLHHRDDSQKAVARALRSILGKPDHEMEDVRHRYYMEYQLDDGTKVTAVFLNSRFVMIMAPTPGDPDRTFYTEPS